MSNKIKQEISKIELPKELNERSKMGVSQAKKEIKNNKKTFIGIAAALLVSIVTFTLFNNHLNNTANNSNIPVDTGDGGVHIPAIQLPEDNMSADMIGLIVYNENIYTQTRTEIDAQAAKDIIGEKLGTTKAIIDEWSEQEAYNKEFASTIGKADVYTVKGYDKDFRIMTYTEQDGKIFVDLYENLNGITINIGQDIFGKLNIYGNISSAQYRTFSDWNNSIDDYQPITDMETLNVFVEELNQTKPLPRIQNSDPISNSRNDEQFRELSINLNDGTTVKLTLLKDGYIYYGFMGAYFKMNEDIFSKLWSILK
ncbi:hypothetical protein F9U64_09190 [Gracilibacillus oryzae]|uniref:Uncharacterized protein n=1 Tax=Gracilibacillus oryzae TaxID=1672701 RepID=A0A7C8KYQ0_9BACI|nr:hypothetical protein [Gracilibacillus oryzae]KAB8137487.1 hypothetical protein F9U64_09190 [Gracilibacillus oryzae]